MITKEEFKIFNDYNNFQNEYWGEVYSKAPICHFTPMEYEHGESIPEAHSYPDWWECKHCGHTKDMK